MPPPPAWAAIWFRCPANASTWSTVAQGTFTSANNGHANTVALRSQPAGVRYVKLRGLSTQQSTSPYMDVAELQVYAKPPVVAAAACRPCACPPPPPPPWQS